jgi:Mn-dependent DtxR family transcriptional regulator
MYIHNNMITKNIMKSLMNIHRFIQLSKVSTTSEVAEKMHLSWNTAEKRLLELALENKVERIKKAGVNLWVAK